MRYGRWIASAAIIPLAALLWGSRPANCRVETDSAHLDFTASEEDTLMVEVLVTVQVPDVGVPFDGAMPMFLIPVSGGEEEDECLETNGRIWAVDQCGWETEVTGGECHVNHVTWFEVSSEGDECDDEYGEARCVLEDGQCSMTYLVEFTSFEQGSTDYDVEIRASVSGVELCEVEDQASIHISVAELIEG